MITDEQGKNWLLQKLYDNGYVLTWSHGGTSWSSPKHCVSEWDHAELVEL